MTQVIAPKKTPSFLEQILDQRFRTTMVITGCLVTIALVQFIVGIKESIIAGALIKQLVFQGQWWRLLTCAFLHGSIIHIVFNGYALFNIGRFLEMFINRGVYLTVYFLAVIMGSTFSLLFTPDGASLGASGGIIGLFGCLGVIAFKYRKVMPAGFLKSIIYNLGIIAVIGFFGRGFIDNASHLGGLLAGIIMGWIFIPADVKALRRPSRPMVLLGNILLVFFVLCSVMVLVRIVWIKILLERFL